MHDTAARWRIARSLLVLLAIVAGCRDAPTAPPAPTGPVADAAAVPRATLAAAAVAAVLPRDLGTLGGPTGYAIDINDSGSVVGYADDATGSSKVARWLPGLAAERVAALGSVVGIAHDGSIGGAPAGDGCRLARWRAPATLILSPTGQPTANACLQGRAMSDSGLYIVGSFAATPTNFIYDLTRPFSWAYSGSFPGGIVVDFGPTSGTWKYSLPVDVSDLSVLVGTVEYPPSRRRAAAWYVGTGLTLLGPDCSSGICNNGARAVNRRGTVVGDLDGHAVRFLPSYLDLLPGGQAVDVNEKDEILIQAGNAAWLLRGATLVPLAGLNGGCCVGVSRVNERSQVAGWATDGATGQRRPAMWDADAAPPVPFQVSPGGPYSGTEAQPVSLTGSVTGGVAPFSWTWSFGGGETATGQQASHAWRDNGTFSVLLTVVDATGASSSASTTATIANAAPTVQVLSVSPTVFLSGGSVAVAARHADAGIGDAPWYLELQAVYERQAPDTTQGSEMLSERGTSNGPSPGIIGASISLRRAGIHTLHVILRDKDGGTAYGGSHTLTVQRLPLGMTARSASPQLLTVTISGTPAMAARDLDPATLRLGNDRVMGAPVATGAGGAPLVELRDVNADGLYELVASFGWDALAASGALSLPDASLVLRARGAGHLEVEARAPIPPRSTPPVIAIGGPYAGTEGSPLQLTATVTGGAAPLSYHWSIGDGAEATTLGAAHVYMDEDSWTATLTARGADGLEATASATVVVVNAAPTLVLEPGATIYSGDLATVHGRVDDAGTGDSPWRWEVRWPSGISPARGELTTVPADVTATATLRRAGAFRLPVLVTDADGGSASGAVTITVVPLPVPVTVSPARETAIDRGNGLFTIVVHSTERVAVADIDVSTVRINGLALATRGNGAWMAALADVDADGTVELVMKVRRAALRDAGASGRRVALYATLRDGREVAGQAALLATAAR